MMTVYMLRIGKYGIRLRGLLVNWPIQVTTESRFDDLPVCSYGTFPNRTSLPAPICLRLEQRRHLIPTFPNPFSSRAKNKNKLQYSECHLLGYSMVQMYEIVSLVEAYHEFVPWCKESAVTHRGRQTVRCKLTVGFPPLLERYSSIVTLDRPHLVKSECSDGKLFKELLTIWRFGPGLPDRPDTCTLKFFVSFEFRSALHSHLARMFFDEVVRTMVDAFLKRAHALHGAQTIKPRRMKVSEYNTNRS